MNIQNIGFTKIDKKATDSYNGTGKGSEIREKTVGYTQQSGAFLASSKDNEYGNQMADKVQDIQEKAQSLVQGTTTNHAEFIANSMDDSTKELLEEQGISEKDEDIDVIVTVVDKIQLQMANGDEGALLGTDLSREQIEAIAGNGAMAYQIAEQLTDIRKEEVAYLIDNEMAPTISNIYQAQSSTYGERGYTPLSVELQKQISEKVAEYTGVEESSVTAQDVELANWMVSTGVAFTQETFTYAKKLMETSLPLSPEALDDAILTAVQSGYSATQAMVLPEFAQMNRAISGKEVVAQATEEQAAILLQQDKEITIENLSKIYIHGEIKDEQLPKEEFVIKARRILEETRLYMSAQANLAFLKKGIQIETKPLEELVEALKQQEQEYHTAVYGEHEAGDETFSKVKEQIQQLKEVPAALLARITFKEMTLPEVTEQGNELAAAYEKASVSYETMMTQPRKDLGDDIGKAFQNVDTILQDMGLETSSENERAVRILGYNQMDITQESIAAIKLKDAQVQQLFTNMTPRVVLSMIREGYNPLKVSLEELNNKAARIKEQQDPKGLERYSEFLVDLETHGEITEEERESYIGIYRLLHQVAKTDGAAVGAVLLADEELTMKNLLTQVRNQKALGYDRIVDEQTGETEGNYVADLSITQQIETAYQTACAGEALKQATVSKMKAVQKDGDLQKMSPEQILEAFREENTTGDTKKAEAASQQENSILRQAAMADKEVMDLLQSLDMPKSPENILALQEMMGNRNKLFRTLFDQKGKNNEIKEALKKVKEKIWEDFSEALSSPEEMAKAQETLAETAEKVMDTMVEDTEMTSIDIRQLQRMSRQLEITMARSRREEYAVPVLVSDEYGTVSLKIVRGEEEEGKVAITLETDKYGKMAASFQSFKESLQGYVVAEKEETKEQLKAGDEALRQSIFKYTGIPMEKGSIAYVSSKDLSLSVFEQGVGESRTDRSSQQKVLTKTLYGVAKGFLTNLQQISFSGL